MMMCSINWSDSAIIAAFVSGGFAAASGIVTLCVYNRKKKIEAKMEKELESYKGWIQASNMRVQGQLDTKLEVLRIEYGVLYTQRLEVIQEMYKQLLQLNNSVRATKKGLSGKKISTEERELIDVQFKIKSECKDYFNENKLFLSEELSTIIDGYFSVLDAEIFKCIREECLVQIDPEQKVQLEPYKELDKIDPKKLFGAIEKEFRSLIGADIKRQ